MNFGASWKPQRRKGKDQMPRNRQIKADTWCDQKIGALSRDARLMFIGTWNFADDSGICRANPIYLKNNIFPYDNFTIKKTQGLLNECSQQGLIRLLEYRNEQYLEIINFLKHQFINRPSKFRYLDNLEEAQEVLNECSLTNVKVNVNENVNENVNSQNSNEFRLSELLFNLILKRNPKHKKPDLQKWTKEIDNMILIDNRQLNDIEAVINWAQADGFWQNNILCTVKLRKQFDQLKLKMEGSNGTSQKDDKFNGLNEKDYEAGAIK